MFRRTFLWSAGAAAALFTPAVGAESGGNRQTAASSQTPKSGPARHAQDDWLDQAPTGHRVIFDTWMADRFGEAVGFAGNWARVNKEQYGLTDADLAIVMVARHGSAPFAANMSANDKVAHPNPVTNVHAERLAALVKQGMRLAVCNLTTRAYTRIIARETGADAEAVYKELTANPVGPAMFVPAGIVAVTRAQERGYALVSIG